MKNYQKIPFNKIKDVGTYGKRKLKEGYVIIRISVDSQSNLIVDLTSYANDRNVQSHYKWHENESCKLSDNVIVQNLEPYYAWLHPQEENVHTADIDIDSESQDIISFDAFSNVVMGIETSLADNDEFRYEYYISKQKMDLGDFGASLELEFIEEWLEENKTNEREEIKMKSGIVKWFNTQKGYGFITDDEGKDVFVHYSHLQIEGFKYLTEGDYVEFELGCGNQDDREQAVNVIPILTFDMVEKSLKEDNLHIKRMKNEYGHTVWGVIDDNNVLQSGDKGLNLLELAAFAGFDVEGLK